MSQQHYQRQQLEYPVLLPATNDPEQLAILKSIGEDLIANGLITPADSLYLAICRGLDKQQEARDEQH